MQLTQTVLLYVHIAAGVLSLILFWVPIISKKGSTLHRSAGHYYVRLMWLVVATAFLLTLLMLWMGRMNNAIFLGFLTLLTANPLWHGIAALKQRHSVSLRYRRLSLAYDFALGLAGLSLLIFALFVSQKGFQVLMIIFGFLGLSSLPRAIKGWRTPPSQINRMAEHIQGMLGTGIAAYTAFFAFGGRQLFQDVLLGYWAIVPWILPAVIGTIGIQWASRKWSPKQV